MKLEEVLRKATKDPAYARKLRDMAISARDEGMKSRAYTALIKEFAETPSDLKSLRSTTGYTQMITWTTSKNAVLCALTSNITSNITTNLIAAGREDEPRTIPSAAAGLLKKPARKRRVN